MRAFLILVVLTSCTMPPSSASPTPSPMSRASETPSPTAAPRVSASPSPAFQDLKVVAAGAVRGDHVLVVQTSSSSTGFASKVTIWDVPLDGSAPRELVTYTRIGTPYTEYDVMSLSRQLSSDGRYLVLSEPLDVAGHGLAILDLVAGSARLITLEGIANQPCWSPDGERIAYRGADIGTVFTQDTGVWVVNAAGGAARQVATSDIAAGSGATLIYGWTDARNVLYKQHDLHVVDTTSGHVTSIPGALTGVTIAAREKRPSVALVFNDETSRAPIGYVEVRDTIYGPGRIVTRYGPSEGTFLTDPRWRPGGNDELLLYYAFGQGVAERHELVIVDGAAGTRRTLPTPSYVRSAMWSADGQQIVYASLTELRARSADGSNDHFVFRPVPAASGDTPLIISMATFAPP
jgi:dipeptidyl aminopeptidase/acylaminoacyl peptidase